MRDRRYDRAALLLWLAALAVVSVMIAADPARRSVTPVFHLAVKRWWAREPLYSDFRGFHYLPQFALLFTPFHALPSPVGDIVWRLVSVGACVGGMRAMIARLRPGAPGRFFFWTSLLALTPCLGAVRNGQTNLAFGGLLLVVAALLVQERWRTAAACLALLLVVKPLGVIVLLLAAAVYRRLRFPAAAAVAVVAVLPFLFAPPGYAVAQYRDAFSHLATWSGTTEGRFADLGGLLRSVGLQLSGSASRWIRAIAGIATLLLSALAAKDRSAPRRALTFALLAATYLMLFNPMTEKNSYAIVAPPLALAATWCLTSARFARIGWMLAFAVVSVGVFPELFTRVDHNFGLWWDPLMMVLVYGLLAWKILRGEPAFPDAPSGPVEWLDER